MNEGLQILIIDDEMQIRRLLRIVLEANGYGVHESANGEHGILSAAQIHPDLIILDMGLPDMDGSNVLKRLREWSQIPVIVLSVRNSDREKVTMLDMGADDYLTKPFSTDELLARIRVAERHRKSQQQQLANFTYKGLQVDLIRRQVSVNGAVIKLTPTEYELLRLLVQNAGRVLTHQHILRAIWGPAYINETHYLRVYFAQLRQKIEANPSLPEIILTESGIGYRLATS